VSAASLIVVGMLTTAVAQLLLKHASRSPDADARWHTGVTRFSFERMRIGAGDGRNGRRGCRQTVFGPAGLRHHGV